MGLPRVLAAVAVVALSGCGGGDSYDILVYPDGTVGARAECVNDELNCHHEASRACPHGYWVISREEEPRMHVHATPHGAHHFHYLAIALNVRCAPPRP
jgi:hypothetical protein